jgi:hypothetical protein
MEKSESVIKKILLNVAVMAAIILIVFIAAYGMDVLYDMIK